MLSGIGNIVARLWAVSVRGALRSDREFRDEICKQVAAYQSLTLAARLPYVPSWTSVRGGARQLP